MAKKTFWMVSPPLPSDHLLGPIICIGLEWNHSPEQSQENSSLGESVYSVSLSFH